MQTNKISPLFFHGLANASGAGYFVSEQFLSVGKNVVYLTGSSTDTLESSLQHFSPPNTKLLLFPEQKIGQMAVLHHLITAQTPYALVVPYSEWPTSLPAPKDFKANTFTIHRGDCLRRSDLLDILQNRGYVREDYTEVPGQYAVRGSVLDLFLPDRKLPYRFYFAGNRIESISTFDIDTQSTQEHIDSACIIPLSFEHTPAILADYINQAQYIFDQPPADFDFSLYEGAAVFTLLPAPQSQDCHLKSNIEFKANFSLLEREVLSLKKQNIQVNITCLNRGELDRLSEIMQDYEELRKLPILISPLVQGFYSIQKKQAFITSGDILNRHYRPLSALKNITLENAQKVRFKELRPGDYVVHQHHGIGKYLGLEIMDKEQNPTDCLIIEYRRGSRLYVPMYDFKRVQKYIGAGGRAPALSALGGSAWKDVKKRVKEEAQKTAKEILKLEAQRQAAGTQALIGDQRIEEEFAASFPFVQTSGQTQAIEDVLKDMSRARSMDRVLVGDVGFGKTEVAMRAALHAVMSAKQVMMVVPTTILADQHCKTFRKRMAGFPVNIEMLCRFQTKTEQKEIIRQLKNGICDIIIGTHRLLSKDISFQDLGLVIIDEEHRFGVKQKEKIKAKSAGVHTLMLSATPIPRTLNQSLSSLRDISLIDTPPRGRTPIKTVVCAWNNEVAAAAIQQELARGGQIYYVYNSVQSMQSRYLFLQHLVPQAKICMAHGQMKEAELEQTLWDFHNGKYDILLASTIIESGLDITNANTLIVENAQNFGLAQLYQLRGRIGRGDQKAYCYLFHPDWLFREPSPQEQDTYHQLLAMPYKAPKEKDPTEEAKKRLAALMEFSDLGSGFKLALRDMEIRGAGELLGVKQHGYVHEVGLSLYCDLVAAEVRKLKGEKTQRPIRATVHLPLPAYISPDYLPDDSERLKYYKELMSADEQESRQILQKLADFAGPVPAELTNLNRILQLSRRAGLLKIYHLEYSSSGFDLFFTADFQMPADFPAKVLEKYGPRVQFIKSRNGDGIHVSEKKTHTPVEQAEEIITFLEYVLKTQNAIV
ncbi:MAG: DEAD/DEAH box helicase [Elusimicrobiaceae bacterium]|nr:DEAD/DEAH box helicase [Elusimicrobiaceae bacterium]